MAFGPIQVSVPSSWVVEDAGDICGGRVRGMVFLGRRAHRMPRGMGCGLPPSLVAITAAAQGAAPGFRQTEVNGIAAEIGSAGGAVVERALGMQIAASGPQAARVLSTLTHSPLSVLLNSAAVQAPAGWRRVVFGGLRFAVPPTWKITRQSTWGGCPFNLSPGLLLSSARTMFTPGCPFPPQNAGYDQAVPGMVLGAGPQIIWPALATAECRPRGALRICLDRPPTGSPLSLTDQYGILTLQVFPLGQSRPDQVEIGLSGIGLTAARVFDSIQPAGS